MCELLGLSFNKPVLADISFRAFRHRGKHNRHGWGFACYPDKAAQIIKEPNRSDNSDLSENIYKNYKIKSKIYISHVRYASAGSVSFCNTHPFSRELFGKEYIFAHNGTLHNFDFSYTHYKPIGQTDSEQAFCYIIDKIKEIRIIDWDKNNFDFLKDLFKKVNEYGDFNCLMSDGEHLFCYFDKNSYNRLHYVKREAPFSKIKLEDEDFYVNLAEEKSRDQKGFIIATNPLTNENWTEFKQGSLNVFKNGEMIWSSS